MSRSLGSNDAGQVTVFVVGLLLAFFVLGALVVDGGYDLAARRQAIDEANEAARAGAEQVDVATYRATGRLELDPAHAKAAAFAYLQAAGHTGMVSVAGDQVQVEVTVQQKTALLRIVGIDTVTVTGRGAATIVSGVGAPAP